MAGDHAKFAEQQGRPPGGADGNKSAVPPARFCAEDAQAVQWAMSRELTFLRSGQSHKRNWSVFRSRPEQVPAIPGDIDEYGDLTVRLVPRLGDELNPHAAHPVVGGLEVVNP